MTDAESVKNIQEIREWAEIHGLKIAKRGRIPKRIIKLYIEDENTSDAIDTQEFEAWAKQKRYSIGRRVKDVIPPSVIAEFQAEHGKACARAYYPILLSNGSIATLELPLLLDRADADRLKAFISGVAGLDISPTCA